MRLPSGYDPSPPPPPQLSTAPAAGRVLLFAPHPDDETIGAGGTLALHARQGDAVQVVLATDGVNGDPDGRFDPADFAARRRGEARAALAELGVRAEPEFWGFPDDCVVGPADLESVTGLAEGALQRFRPDVVYLPWPGERNGDHRALFAGVAGALDRIGFQGLALGYEVWTPCEPDLLVDIGPTLDAKRSALGCHATQLAYVDYDHVIVGLSAYRSLLVGRGRGHYEAFVRIDGGTEVAR